MHIGRIDDRDLLEQGFDYDEEDDDDQFDYQGSPISKNVSGYPIHSKHHAAQFSEEDDLNDRRATFKLKNRVYSNEPEINQNASMAN